jgi:hypothetical protein
VVLAAAVTASRERNRLTMLAADATDWPREWYRRLGFVEACAVWESTTSTSERLSGS